MSAPELLVIILVIFSVVMFLLALSYLCRRKLSWMEYGAFGLLALLVPVLGPFLVIALRPGRPRP